LVQSAADLHEARVNLLHESISWLVCVEGSQLMTVGVIKELA
jgi:hypothetical protein